RAPTHAPTGSTLLSFDHTAIFVRCPGSRAHALISTMPSAISGTSSSNKRLMRPGCVRDTTICGPFEVLRTSTMYALTRAPGSGRSYGTCSAWGSSASTRPRSSSVYRLSFCWMMPVTMSPSRPAYSSYFCSRSISRRRCVITCFAVCAAMRPKSDGVTSISSPYGSPSSSSSCANTRNSKVSGSIVTHAYSYASSRRLYADSSASASALRRVSTVMPFSAASICSASIISRLLMGSGRLLLAGVLLCRAPLEHRAGLLDLVVGEVTSGDRDAAVVARLQHPAHAPVTFDVRARLHGDLGADGAREVRGRTQRTLEAGTRHLERVAA